MTSRTRSESRGHKVPAIAALKRRYGTRISLLADSLTAVAEVARQLEMAGETLALFLEIDCGGRRGGVLPEGPELMALGQAVQASPRLSLAGVLTHAGQSYDAATAEAIRDIAEDERAAVTLAASRLRAAGIEVPVVSAGSTPTAIHACSMSGVTEMRPGVYTLFDLAQVALGSCTVEDVAVSVLASVIGHNPRAGRVLIDAGALALSKDLSGNKRGATVGYGLVCAANGDRPPDRLHVADVHQEHGLVAGPRPYHELVETYPVGARVRILPNHACLTAGPYDRYHLVRGGTPASSTCGRRPPAGPPDRPIPRCARDDTPTSVSCPVRPVSWGPGMRGSGRMTRVPDHPHILPPCPEPARPPKPAAAPPSG